jgi:hypothetical protein
MRRLFLALTMGMLLFCALPGPATAGEAASPLGLSLADFMSGTVFPLLSALVMALVGWAAVSIGKKYKIDALIANEALIQDAAYKGVALAEEYAARLLKEKNIKLTGSLKLDRAIAQVLKAAPQISREDAREYVESVLARVKGAGATGETVVA